MPHRTRPMTALLVFTGLNVFLVSTITPVYDFVCFLPYWERRLSSEARLTLETSLFLIRFDPIISLLKREQRRQQQEVALAKGFESK
ncbi:uncharacterized protein LOC111987897 [Quercus suber]|uniref:uncharacterized protein LOC111987897 n=1 Tax=Quercus suber TaxID=58331 RepID=UPI0032DE5AA5